MKWRAVASIFVTLVILLQCTAASAQSSMHHASPGLASGPLELGRDRVEVATHGLSLAQRKLIELIASKRIQAKLNHGFASYATALPDTQSDAALTKKQRTRPYLQRKLWFVTTELLAMQAIGLAALSRLPPESTGWGVGKLSNIPKHFMQGPHFDGDPWYWNYIAHPVSGSEYYLLARNRESNWIQSLAYAAVMSAVWEFGTEGIYERASWQDLVITPLAGAALGELRYQLKQSLLKSTDGHTTKRWKKALVIAIDPIDALTKL